MAGKEGVVTLKENCYVGTCNHSMNNSKERATRSVIVRSRQTAVPSIVTALNRDKMYCIYFLNTLWHTYRRFWNRYVITKKPYYLLCHFPRRSQWPRDIGPRCESSRRQHWYQILQILLEARNFLCCAVLSRSRPCDGMTPLPRTSPRVLLNMLRGRCNS